MTVQQEQRDWLDGPRTMEWIQSQVDPEDLKDKNGPLTNHMCRNLRRWRKGDLVDVYALDPILIALGLHLSHVPDDLYLAYFPSRHRHPQEVKEQALEALADGAMPATVARQMGLSYNTVKGWDSVTSKFQASEEQAMAALAEANRRRLYGAICKQRLHDGDISLRDVLYDPELQHFRLSMVLGWMKRYGPSRIRRLMQIAEVRPAFLEWRLERLTDRQKEALATAVKGKVSNGKVGG